MKEGRVKVVIDDNKRIPTIGKGPIRTPIFITKSQFELIKKLGFKIKEVGELKQKSLNTTTSELKSEDIIKDTTSVVNEELGADEALEEESTESEVVEEVETSEDNSETIDEESKLDVTEVEEDNEEVIVDAEDEIESYEEDDVDSPDEDDDISDEEEEEYVDIDSLTKSEIKKKLDELGVSYGKNANITTLKNLLMENLPE